LVPFGDQPLAVLMRVAIVLAYAGMTTTLLHAVN